MTWLWTLLIVVGAAMIVVAVWPGLIGLATKKEPTETEPETPDHQGI